jgi:hypothetical protein
VAFKFYTFGSRFNYNNLVEVLLLYTFDSCFIYKRWVEVCNFIPLVCVLFVSVGSRFVTHLVRILIINVGSGFAIKSEF